MRPSKDKYYLAIAQVIAERSTCFRRKIGALIVKDDVIVATGYVGAPRKTKDCLERGECLREKLGIPHGERYELCRSVHAEMNAIINAARSGAQILGSDLFIWGSDRNGHPVNAFPCFLCKKMIINAGIKRVICSTQKNGLKVFKTGKWGRDWQVKDIIDDKERYGM